MTQSLSAPSLLEQQIRQLSVRLDQGRPQAQRLQEGGFGLFGPIVRNESCPQLIVGQGESWLQADGVVIAAGCLAPLSLCLEDIAQIIVGLGTIRTQADGFAEAER